jgi:hypothetical protein
MVGAWDGCVDLLRVSGIYLKLRLLNNHVLTHPLVYESNPNPHLYRSSLEKQNYLSSAHYNND